MKDTASRRGTCESGGRQGQKDREMLECFMVEAFPYFLKIKTYAPK